jgi:hypothetical protein
MIRRNTWITLVVLLAAIGAAYYYVNVFTKNSNAATSAAATLTPASITLFPSGGGVPVDIQISDAAGQSVEIGRDATGNWVVKAPTAAPADQAAAEAAATQLTALQVQGKVKLGPSDVGLDKPAYVMTVKLTGGATHTLNVGSVTPVQTGYYVQLDGGPIQVADKTGLDALLGMLSAPPYVPTATPAVTDTPAAAGPGTATPGAGAAPATPTP